MNAPRMHARPRDVLRIILVAIVAVVSGVLVMLAVSRQLSITGQLPGDGEAVGATAMPTTPAITPTPTPTPTPTADPNGDLAAKLTAALNALAFPATFDPPLESLSTQAWVDGVEDAGCADIVEANVEACVTGTGAAGKDVAVLGDFFAIAYLPAIQAAYEPLGWRVHPYTLGECAAADVAVQRSATVPFPECAAHRDWAITAIDALSPDLVILADSQYTVDRLVSGATGDEGLLEVQEGYESTIDRLAPSGARVMLLAPPPRGPAITECAVADAVPADCISPIDDDWIAFSEMLGAAKAAAASGYAEYLDTQSWFCIAGACPSVVGSTPVRADGAHLTSEYARGLGGVLAAATQPG